MATNKQIKFRGGKMLEIKPLECIKIWAVVENVYTQYEEELAKKVLNHIKNDIWDKNSSEIKKEGNSLKIEFEGPYHILTDGEYWERQCRNYIIGEMKLKIVNVEAYYERIELLKGVNI